MHFCANRVQAQCIAPDFTSPATVCKEQRVFFEPDNTYSSYEWDLCTGELDGTPTATVLTNNFGGYGFKVELVEQGGAWFGFFVSRGTNKLWRLDFGTSITNTPILVDLGGLGKSSPTWRVIEIVKEGSNYLGFIVDESVIYRISFGTSLSNNPTPAQVLYDGTPLNLPIDLIAVEEGTSKYLFAANRGNDNVVRIKFGASWNDSAAALTLTTLAPPSTAVAYAGLSMMKDCDKWYAIASSIITGNLYKFAFDDGLDDTTPTVSVHSAPYSPAGLMIVKENNKFMAFIQGQNGTNSLVRVNFGSTLANAPSGFDALNNIGYIGSNLWGFSMYKVKSDWLIMSAENAGANLYRITFPQSCFSNTSWSTEAKPVVTSKTAGNFNVSLDVTNGSGLHSSISHPIQVTGNTAPDIEFTSANICAGQNVNFNSTNTSGGITSYNWSFGDSGSASIEDPSHVYAQGLYTVNLIATSSGTGCSNTVNHPVKIYPPPVADFQLPSGLICTNNQFSFTNQIADVYDGKLTYQWSVDGTPASTTRDLQFAFAGTGDKVVRLVGSIPGCSDDQEKTLMGILPGPTAAYTIDGQCQGTNVSFVNGSTGAISYTWNFDNGSTSPSTNASTTYNTTGLYEVSLAAQATNGCITTLKKELTIYSLPAPAFTLDLPPFSCARTPSQFHDGTPTPTDSNVQSWVWDFGDNGSGTGKDPVHTYLSGSSFNVRLTALTDKGCSASATQQVTIAESPVAAFSSDPSCANQATHFDDQSTGSIKTWQWKIANSNYSSPNLTHVFLAPGTYQAQLTVRGTNDCVATITRSIIVPPVPVVEFQVTNACSGQDAVFTDITATPDDPTLQRTWTFNNDAVASGTSVMHAFEAPGSYPVELRIANQSGCSYSLSRQVTINPSPVVDFTASPESGPPPLEVKFTGTATNATVYNWDFNDGKPASTALQPIHVFDQLGQYAVDFTATTAAGCTFTKSRIINVIVPVNELQMISFRMQEADNDLFNGMITLRNNGNYNVKTVTVYYNLGSGIRIRETLVLPGESGLAPATTGVYELTNQFVTSGLSSGYICAELEEDTDNTNNRECFTLASEPTVFDPYPNPASSTISVEVVSTGGAEIHVVIFDMKGDVAFDRKLNGSGGLRSYAIDVQNLVPGIYMMQISSGGQTLSRRFSIVR